MLMKWLTTIEGMEGEGGGQGLGGMLGGLFGWLFGGEQGPQQLGIGHTSSGTIEANTEANSLMLSQAARELSESVSQISAASRPELSAVDRSSATATPAGRDRAVQVIVNNQTGARAQVNQTDSPGGMRQIMVTIANDTSAGGPLALAGQRTFGWRRVPKLA